jgi:hypothetical protein
LIIGGGGSVSIGSIMSAGGACKKQGSIVSLSTKLVIELAWLWRCGIPGPGDGVLELMMTHDCGGSSGFGWWLVELACVLREKMDKQDDILVSARWRMCQAVFGES